MPSALAFALFQQIHLFFEMLQGSYTRHGIEVAGCRPGFIPVTPDNRDIFDGTGMPTGVGFARRGKFNLVSSSFGRITALRCS